MKTSIKISGNTIKNMTMVMNWGGVILLLLLCSVTSSGQVYDSKTYFNHVDESEWHQYAIVSPIDNETIQLSMVAHSNDTKRTQIRRLESDGTPSFTIELEDIYPASNGFPPTCKPVDVVVIPNTGEYIVCSYVLNPYITTPTPTLTLNTPKWEIRITKLDGSGNILGDRVYGDAVQSLLPTCMDYDPNTNTAVLGVNAFELIQLLPYQGGLWAYTSLHDLVHESDIMLYQIAPNNLTLSSIPTGQRRYNFNKDFTQSSETSYIKDIKVLQNGEYLYTGLYYHTVNKLSRSYIGVGLASNTLTPLNRTVIGPPFWLGTGGAILHEATQGQITIGFNGSPANHTPETWGYFAFDVPSFTVQGSLNWTGQHNVSAPVSSLCGIVESPAGYPFLDFIGVTHFEAPNTASTIGYCLPSHDSYENSQFFAQIDVQGNNIMHYNLYPAQHGTNSAPYYWNIPNGFYQPMSKQLIPTMAVGNTINQSVDAYMAVNVDHVFSNHKMNLRRQSLEPNVGYLDCSFINCNFSIDHVSPAPLTIALPDGNNVSEQLVGGNTGSIPKGDDIIGCPNIYTWEGDQNNTELPDIEIDQNSNEIYVSFYVEDVEKFQNFIFTGTDGRMISPIANITIGEGWNYATYNKNLLSTQLYIFAVQYTDKIDNKKILLQ